MVRTPQRPAVSDHLVLELSDLTEPNLGSLINLQIRNVPRDYWLIQLMIALTHFASGDQHTDPQIIILFSYCLLYDARRYVPTLSNTPGWRYRTP